MIPLSYETKNNKTDIDSMLRAYWVVHILAAGL